MGTISYDKDVILWSLEQAALLRSGQLTQLDLEHLADEIEDVGKSEQREVASRMAVLLAHLMKWHFQPDRRGKSREDTIAIQRERIALAVKKTPSLKSAMLGRDWQDDAWLDAVGQASNETGLARIDFESAREWPQDRVLAPGWLPEASGKA